MQILQINFVFNMTKADFLALTAPAAEAIAQVEGCIWKIWLLNEKTREGGGIYLFESVATAQVYLDGPLIGGLTRHPALSNVSVRLSGCIEGPTRITRGPIDRSTAVGDAKQVQS